MDGSIEPDVYVMTQAWYVVVPTGAQAAVAMNLLSELFSSDHPNTIEVLSKDIYVDEFNPGAETEAERDKQISSTQSVLQQEGFGFKYVVYSGRTPGEKASPDGIHVKLLGTLNWIFCMLDLLNLIHTGRFEEQRNLMSCL